MMRDSDVQSAMACAIIIGVLAIIGALWVLYEAVRILMPVLIWIDGAGRCGFCTKLYEF